MPHLCGDGVDLLLGIASLNHRRHLASRWYWPRAARWDCAVLALALGIAGCQSGGQHDVVVRELRMQEDQLYALENYLTQYQQLVRKYRSENTALRRQLAEVQGETDGILPTRAPEPGERPSKASGPSLSEPAIPPPQGTPMPADGTGPEEPMIPPLEPMPSASSSSFNSVGNESVVASSTAVSGKATLAQLVLVDNDSTPPAAGAVDAAHRMSMQGEVRANAAGGGPRLVVDIEMSDADTAADWNDATLSIMLLTRADGATPQSLARWDFSAEELLEAAALADDRIYFRFYLELPEDTAATAATEIWARCLQASGEKTLVHADIDLLSPSEFSSRSIGPLDPVAGARQIPASTHERLVTTSAQDSLKLDEAEWTIARPGEPAVGKLLSSAQETWRAASQPIPAPKLANSAVKLASAVASSEGQHGNTAVSAPSHPYRRPTWSPNRANTGSAAPPASASQKSLPRRRPTWSPTR